MGLFDRTAARLSAGPTVLLAGDPTELLRRYDPNLRRQADRFVFTNGIHLHGPIEITPKLAAKTGLPTGAEPAYYADVGARRAQQAGNSAVLDHEWLVRGLAARHPCAKFSRQPWATTQFQLSVFGTSALTAQQVADVLAPFAGDNDDDRWDITPVEDEAGDYLLTPQSAWFMVSTYRGSGAWRPSRLPPAVAALSDRGTDRWDLFAGGDCATTEPDVCRTVGAAAVTLARAANGLITDMFGFPITTPEDALPG